VNQPAGQPCSALVSGPAEGPRHIECYWAEGLTAVYLEGALERAINAERAIEVEFEAPEAPAYEGPAPDPATRAPKAPPYMDARSDLAEGLR